MKKLIFLLFLLLIGCAPVATVPLTVTALPPSPTITPSPTLPPSPTTTPEGFQIDDENGGAVQVFENGKWMDLKAPEGIWGPVDGTKVVLVDDGEGGQDAYTQMELAHGFQDAQDNDTYVSMARYNKETKKWDKIPFAFARTPESVSGYNSRNYSVEGVQDGRSIGYFDVGNALLGINFDPERKESPFEVLVAYKNRVVRVKVGELFVQNVAIKSGGQFSVDPERISLDQVLELVSVSQSLNPPKPTDSRTVMDWFFPTTKAVAEDCNDRGGVTPTEEFVEWCRNQILIGKSRKILDKAAVEQLLLFSSGNFQPDGEMFENPNDLWNLTSTSSLDEGWLIFGFVRTK